MTVGMMFPCNTHLGSQSHDGTLRFFGHIADKVLHLEGAAPQNLSNHTTVNSSSHKESNRDGYISTKGG